MAVVPWGVLLGADEAPRVLRWAAIERVELESRMSMAAVLGRGARIFSALATAGRARCRVVIETRRERHVGEAREHAPLERLVAHLAAYTREQAAHVALGLGDDAPSLAPGEPFVEPLLAAARAFLGSADAMISLGLTPAGYRGAGTGTATDATERVLQRILSDRRARVADGRAFASVLAAELGAYAVVPELVLLTQSPHPVLAAVARQAARALGVPRGRAGSVDELTPFLWESDRARLEAWRPERVPVSAAG